MSKISLADLQYDLGRKTGSALAGVVAELLARGKSGRRVLSVAVRESGRGGELLEALRSRGGQAVELLTRFGDFDTDQEALHLLLSLSPADMGRKAVDMWDRGEREVAVRLARLVSERTGHYLAGLVLARELRAQGRPADAVTGYGKAMAQGAPFGELWPELGAALEEEGRAGQAMGLYHAAYDRTRAPEALAAMAALLARAMTGTGRAQAQECCGRVLQLVADHRGAGAVVLRMVMEQLARGAARELDHLRAYLDELAADVCELHKHNRELLEETLPQAEVAARLVSAASAGAERSFLLTQHLMVFERFEPEPQEATAALRAAVAANGPALEVVAGPGLPTVQADPVLLGVAFKSLLAWTRRYWPGALVVEVHVQGDGVLFRAQGADRPVTEPTFDLRWHTASGSLARHGGELEPSDGGWTAWLPVRPPQAGLPVARRLVELLVLPDTGQEWLEEVTAELEGLGTGGTASSSLVATLATAAAEITELMVAENTAIVAYLCHDIKNAFAFVNHWAGEAGSAAVTLIHRRVEENVRRIEEWLEAARDYLALSGRPELAYHQPGAVVQAALGRLVPALKQGGVDLVTDIDPALPRVELDPGRITSLVDNLVLNASRAMPGGGQVRVSVKKRVDEGTVVLEVADTGAGISPEAIQRALGFPRNGGADRRSLGLLTVRKIAQDHNAELQITSEPGSGTRVTVALPAGEVERRLAAALPGLGRLGEETRRALRAAAGLAAQPQYDPQVVNFLLGKAIEMEVGVRLLPLFERHLLLPGATAGVASGRLERVASILGVAADRALLGRCQALETAIVKGRHAKELEDLRNLALAVAAFTAAGGPGAPVGVEETSAEELQALAAALYQCGELASRTKEGQPLIRPAYRLLSLVTRLPAVGK